MSFRYDIPYVVGASLTPLQEQVADLEDRIEALEGEARVLQTRSVRRGFFKKVWPFGHKKIEAVVSLDSLN